MPETYSGFVTKCLATVCPDGYIICSIFGPALITKKLAPQNSQTNSKFGKIP